jgi:hypothetical protein
MLLILALLGVKCFLMSSKKEEKEKSPVFPRDCDPKANGRGATFLTINLFDGDGDGEDKLKAILL